MSHEQVEGTSAEKRHSWRQASTYHEQQNFELELLERLRRLRSGEEGEQGPLSLQPNVLNMDSPHIAWVSEILT